MKASIKLLLSLLTLGLMAPAFALRAEDTPPPAEGQRPRGGGGQGGGRGGQMLTVERLEEAVGKLTDDQKAKIKDVLAKAQKEMQGLSQEERRAKGRELQQAMRKDIRALLTEEQQKKFDAMPAPGRGQRGGGANGGGQAPRPPGN